MPGISMLSPYISEKTKLLQPTSELYLIQIHHFYICHHQFCTDSRSKFWQHIQVLLARIMNAIGRIRHAMGFYIKNFYSSKKIKWMEIKPKSSSTIIFISMLLIKMELRKSCLLIFGEWLSIITLKNLTDHAL